MRVVGNDQVGSGVDDLAGENDVLWAGQNYTFWAPVQHDNHPVRVLLSRCCHVATDRVQLIRSHARRVFRRKEGKH